MINDDAPNGELFQIEIVLDLVYDPHIRTTTIPIKTPIGIAFMGKIGDFYTRGKCIIALHSQYVIFPSLVGPKMSS